MTFKELFLMLVGIGVASSAIHFLMRLFVIAWLALYNLVW